MLAWYDLYPAVLRRLESGDTPSVVHLFCGAGGDAEGRRRAGGTGIGVDASAQPDFVRRFGEEAFVQGDATEWSLVEGAKQRSRAFGCMAGPPCQFYSTIRINGEARSPPLIDGTRDLLAATFELWSIENVPGAAKHMRAPVELRGSDFGLRVDRPRLFEANFDVHVDECVSSAGLGRFIDQVPGPLLRASHGKLLTHMPIAVGSSYKHLIGALKGAWEISSAMEEPDLELDLEGLEKPKWAHHTFRRTSDRFARASMKETGVSEVDIDDQFGWEQAERAKKQQLAYAGRQHRAQRARITMMI